MENGMINLRKDWLDNPRGKARAEAAIAIAALRAGYKIDDTDVPDEIKNLCASVELHENDASWSATPLKVRIAIVDGEPYAED
jgi:hypothetical protein